MNRRLFATLCRWVAAEAKDEAGNFVWNFVNKGTMVEIDIQDSALLCSSQINERIFHFLRLSLKCRKGHDHPLHNRIQSV